MGSLELSEITEFPKERVLYNEVLCDKVNSKLKKLHVLIKQTATADGSKVYDLDIRGIRHKFRLHINFGPQDLCFLRFDEFKENVQESSCFPCLSRNYYPSLVYSRIMFLLYSDPGNGTEAKCIKIPLLQRGNISAATSLRKLQYVVHANIAGQDELKHWLVHVVSCGGFDAGESLFLGVTRYALVLVQYFHILQYHAFFTSDISVKAYPDNKQVDITVTDKNDPSMCSQYTFRSVDWKSIESTLKSVQRRSATFGISKPQPHFNIIHSELSSSGFVPGTTSDNVAIMPHYFTNNNSSSGSNGYLHPYTWKPTTNNVTVHDEPQPHYPDQQWTSSSNGHIPGSDPFRYSSDPYYHDDDEDTFARHSEIVRQSNLPLLPDLNDSELHANPPAPHNLNSLGQNTDPLQSPNDLTLPRSPSTHGLQGLVNRGYEPGPSDAERVSRFFSDNFEDLPPPAPCSAQPHPHVDFFTYKPQVQVPEQSDDDSEPLPPAPHRLLRSISCSLSSADMMDHWYINTEQCHFLRGNVYGDSPYVRFYYNVGFVRFARMSKKIQRRKRLSKEMAKVDFNRLENHEQWFDQCYKLREKDLRFCRLTRLNIEKPEQEDGYSSVSKESAMPDDPYWNSGLCLTIQQMLQEGPCNTRLSEEIQQAFDLSHEQLATMQVMLSLVPSERNWRDLAEYIGLDCGDVSIIEHYCYTYRELATRVVLYHWLREDQQGKQSKSSSYENLHSFIESIDRRDIKDIMDSRNANRHLQSIDRRDIKNNKDSRSANRHLQRQNDMRGKTEEALDSVRMKIMKSVESEEIVKQKEPVTKEPVVVRREVVKQKEPVTKEPVVVRREVVKQNKPVTKEPVVVRREVVKQNKPVTKEPVVVRREVVKQNKPVTKEPVMVRREVDEHELLDEEFSTRL